MIVVQLRAQPQEAFVSLHVPLLSSKSCAGEDAIVSPQDALLSLMKQKKNQTKELSSILLTAISCHLLDIRKPC